MAEGKLNIGIGLIGDDRPKHKFVKPVMLHDVIRWIEAQGFDAEMTAGLIKKVSKYPVHTYQSFRENLGRHQEQVKRELRGTRPMSPDLPDIPDSPISDGNF